MELGAKGLDWPSRIIGAIMGAAGIIWLGRLVSLRLMFALLLILFGVLTWYFGWRRIWLGIDSKQFLQQLKETKEKPQ